MKDKKQFKIKSKIQKVSIDKLVEAKWNYKTDGTSAQLKKLKNAIEFAGSFGVLMVRELDSGMFEVIDGNHRLKVIKELGHKEVAIENFGVIEKSKAFILSKQRNEQWFDDDSHLISKLLNEDVLKDYDEEQISSVTLYAIDDVEFLADLNNDYEQVATNVDIESEKFEKESPDLNKEHKQDKTKIILDSYLYSDNNIDTLYKCFSKKTIVLLSGGIDSITTLKYAITRHRIENIITLFFNYGQKSSKQELTAFNKVCDFYEIKESERHVLNLDIFDFLKDNSIVGIPEEDSNKEKESLMSTYVNFRNGIFLSIAVSMAEVLKAKSIYLGLVFNETNEVPYPDCKEEFICAMNLATKHGVKRKSKIKILTPYIYHTKQEVVDEGVDMGVPYDLSYSCSRGLDKQCGICNSCEDTVKVLKNVV